MGQIISIGIAILVGLVLLGKCTGDEHPEDSGYTNLEKAMAADSVNGSSEAVVSEGESISVPSDPGASYRLLKWSRLSNGNLEAISRRDGSSGTSFARREIDCDALTFRYLGEGDTLDEALVDSPNPGEMSALTDQSISTYVSKFTCDKARSSAR